MTYNELAELFKQEGGDAQVCFSVISQNQILFGNNDTKKDIIGFKNEEPIKWVKETQEEPVSNDLEEAAYQFGNCFENHFGLASMSFIKGAKWQKEQMEKNRIAHCDNITEEQYNLETGFLDDFLDKNKRMPTFLDAIEYGMKKAMDE